MKQSSSNVVQSMANDKNNEPSDIEQNTLNEEQSTSNVVQSSINVEQNIDVVNDSSDKRSSVNTVADSQPVKSFSSSEDHPTWAEVVAMEEAASLTAPAPSTEPVQERKGRSLGRSVHFAGSGLPVRLRWASRVLANVARSAKSSS